MTRAKRPILSLLIALTSLVGLGLVIWKVPPQNFWVEALVIILTTLSLTLFLSWLIGNTKHGVRIALAIVGLLLLRRLDILNWLSVGLWIAAFGLISLVN